MNFTNAQQNNFVQNNNILKAQQIVSGNNILDLTAFNRIKFNNINNKGVYIDLQSKESDIIINLNQLEGKELNDFTIKNLVSTNIVSNTVSADYGYFKNIQQDWAADDEALRLYKIDVQNQQTLQDENIQQLSIDQQLIVSNQDIVNQQTSQEIIDIKALIQQNTDNDTLTVNRVITLEENDIITQQTLINLQTELDTIVIPDLQPLWTDIGTIKADIITINENLETVGTDLTSIKADILDIKEKDNQQDIGMTATGSSVAGLLVWQGVETGYTGVLQTQMVAVQGQVSVLESTATTMQIQSTTQQEEISMLQGDTTIIKTEQTVQKTAVGVNTGKITALEVLTGTHTVNIATLDGLMSTKLNKNDFELYIQNTREIIGYEDPPDNTIPIYSNYKTTFVQPLKTSQQFTFTDDVTLPDGTVQVNTTLITPDQINTKTIILNGTDLQTQLIQITDQTISDNINTLTYGKIRTDLQNEISKCNTALQNLDTLTDTILSLKLGTDSFTVIRNNLSSEISKCNTALQNLDTLTDNVLSLKLGTDSFTVIRNNLSSEINNINSNKTVTDSIISNDTINKANNSLSLSNITDSFISTTMSSLSKARIQTLLSINVDSTNSKLGYGVLSSLTSGTYNTGVGHTSQYSLTTGQYNTSVGCSSLYYNQIGSQNTALGHKAGQYCTGTFNTFVGSTAGYNLTTGINNIIIGANTRPSIVTVNNEIVIGTGKTGKGTNTTYLSGITVYINDGDLIVNKINGNLFSTLLTTINSALQNYDTLTDNIISLKLGTDSFTKIRTNLQTEIDYIYSLVNGVNQMSITVNSVINNDTINKANNSLSLDNLTDLVLSTKLYTESKNKIQTLLHLDVSTATNHRIGLQTLDHITTGLYNMGFGTSSQQYNESGSYNTSLGHNSSSANIVGSNNTALGYRAGCYNTGSDNIFIGVESGKVLQNGSGNIIIGKQSDTSATTGQNQIVIGNGKIGKGDNTTYISGTNVYIDDNINLLKINGNLFSTLLSNINNALNSDTLTDTLLSTKIGTNTLTTIRDNINTLQYNNGRYETDNQTGPGGATLLYTNIETPNCYVNGVVKSIYEVHRTLQCSSATSSDTFSFGLGSGKDILRILTFSVSVCSVSSAGTGVDQVYAYVPWNDQGKLVVVHDYNTVSNSLWVNIYVKGYK